LLHKVEPVYPPEALRQRIVHHRTILADQDTQGHGALGPPLVI
jgi:hypothetical protein